MSSIKKNFSYNVILTVTQVIVPMIMYAYVSRVIMPYGVGTVSFVENICRYIMLIAALGIPIYGIREIARKKNENQDGVFSELISIHLYSSLLLVVIYTALIYLVPQFSANKNMFLIGISLVVCNVLAIEWFYQGNENFRYITVRTVIVRSLSLLLVFIFIKKPQDYYLFFVILCGSSVINGVINFLYSRKYVKFTLVWKWERLRKHIKPLLLIFASTAAISIYVLLDSVFLGFISSKDAVGYYSLGLRVSKAPVILVTALGSVLIPKLSQAHASGDDAYFNRLIQKSFDFVGIVAFPVIVSMIALSNEIIIIFAGEKFLPAKTSFCILCIVIYLIGISNILGMQMLTTTGRDSLMTKSVFFGLVCSIVLNIILIPHFNEVGAAIANLSSELCVTFIMFYFVRKNFHLNINYRVTLLSLFCSLPILGIIYFTSNLTDSLIKKLVFAGISIGVYQFFVQYYIIKEENFITFTSKIIKRYAKI
ncbi:flippase [Chryseobacterium sp. SN22]|uniref:flippase n=1 Tax=Chryseobacterium sp. SN22 TaxID=2606431 RepID=UPI0016280C92|nr:flippase [Chryseobacterium sp. SN22]